MPRIAYSKKRRSFRSGVLRLLYCLFVVLVVHLDLSSFANGFNYQHNHNGSDREHHHNGQSRNKEFEEVFKKASDAFQ